MSNEGPIPAKSIKRPHRISST